MNHSPLLDRWLNAVNQPVVDDIEYRVGIALGIISDRGNFTRAECQAILREIVGGEATAASAQSASLPLDWDSLSTDAQNSIKGTYLAPFGEMTPSQVRSTKWCYRWGGGAPSVWEPICS